MIGLWVTKIRTSIHGIPGRARLMMMAGLVVGLLYLYTIIRLARNDMVLVGEGNHSWAPLGKGVEY